MSSSQYTPKPLTPVPAPWCMPFYYSALANLGAYYTVPVKNVEPFLKGKGLIPAVFDGMAMVSFNLQMYCAQFSSGVDGTPPEKWGPVSSGVTQEIELNILCIPEVQKNNVSRVTAREFVIGEEQTKFIGNYRLWVPCDGQVAVDAGTALFGERKFLTKFAVNLPAYNPVRPDAGPFYPQWIKEWGFRCFDPHEKEMFTCKFNVSGMDSFPSNFSPITEFGHFEGQLIANRWNILIPIQTWFIEDSDPREVVDLTFGNSDHEMRLDMESLLENGELLAVRSIQSQPVASANRAFYVGEPKEEKKVDEN